ncbi:MAG: hypothetical protein P8X59_07820 [Woeseiaceae bacterium]|jgi:hypothetical protein
MKSIYPITVLAWSIAGSSLAAGPGMAEQHLSAAQQAMNAAERNRVYAPRDPNDMEMLRKAMALIGPGAKTPYPTAGFPDYLNTPESVEELMLHRVAVRKKRGRTPLSLAGPGDIVLIPILCIHQPNDNPAR